jgi:hypothetical protein
MANPDALGPASMALGTTTTVFMSFLPKFTDVSKADPGDTGMTKDIRLGEIASVTVAMGTGLIFSHFTGSPAPVVVSAVMCTVLILLYENARKAA